MKAAILPFAPISRQRLDGVAVLPSASGLRTYICDPDNHRIDVVDEDEQRLFSFGSYGPLRGQLNTPSDVAVVPLHPHEASRPDAAVIAVADRGNNRVQFFRLDGEPFRGLDWRAIARAKSQWAARSGWPFFRLAAASRLVAPSRLEWTAPFLEVTVEGGASVRLQMPVAILPEFSDWLRSANPIELRHALNHFLLEPYRDEIPASCLQRIAEHLKPASPDSLETLYGRTA